MAATATHIHALFGRFPLIARALSHIVPHKGANRLNAHTRSSVAQFRRQNQPASRHQEEPPGCAGGFCLLRALIF